MKKFSWAYFAAGLMLFSSLVLTVHIVRAIARPTTPKETKISKSKGPADAPIEIVEYSDFQCPACARIQPYIAGLFEKYPGKIRLAFRHFPLPAHPNAPLAHLAAQCAEQQGKFWEYHDHLFRDQGIWSELKEPLATFIAYAKESGLKLDAFGECLTNRKTLREVEQEKREGKGLGVQSTPSFVVNGRLHAGSLQMMSAGEVQIQEELKQRELL